MSEQPEGRFLQVMPSRKVTASLFHLFRDCSRFKGWGDSVEIVDLDAHGTAAGDRLLGFLALRACSVCQKRRDALDEREMLVLLLRQGILSADRMLLLLDEAGWKLVKK